MTDLEELKPYEAQPSEDSILLRDYVLDKKSLTSKRMRWKWSTISGLSHEIKNCKLPMWIPGIAHPGGWG